MLKKGISKFTKSIYLPFLILLFVGTLSLFVFSIFQIISNEILIQQLNSQGFNNFLDLFRFPIGMMAAIVVIMTLFNSALKYLQFEQQFELNRHHLSMSNYYKHMDEFKKSLMDIKNSIEYMDIKYINSLNSIFNSLTDQECRKLYLHWFGTQFDSTHRVLPEVKKKVKNYYEAVLGFDTIDELSNSKFNTLSAVHDDLGFSSIFHRLTIEDCEHIDYAYVYLCENILEFSSDTLRNGNGVSIGENASRHLTRLK